MTPAAFGIAWLDRIVSDLPTSLAVLLAAVIVVSALAAIVLIVVARRGRRKEVHEIVKLLEEMRSGRSRARIDLDPRSPFAAIAESVNRLGQDLHVRWSRGEAASEGFQALQEAARGYAVVATDADGDLRSVSPGAAQLFGWEEDAVIGRNASLLFDDASWKELLPKLARKSLRERGVETRALMARRDGTRFHARLLVRLLRGHAEEHPGFLLVVQDVTEQVRVESELRDSELRSRRMLDHLPGSVALVQGGRIVYANAALRTLLGVGEREATGFPLLDRIATNDVLVVQDALTALESGGAGSDYEATVTLIDQARRPTGEARFVAMVHAHEGKPAVLVTLRDETVERRLFRGLAAQEARLDAALDAWDDGLLLVEDDPAGPRVRLANRAFHAMFGLGAAEVAGATEGDLMRALRARGEFGAAVAACLAAATSHPAHDVVETGTRSLAVRAQPFGAPGAAVRGRLLAVRDATEEIAALRERTEAAELWHTRHDASEVAFASLHELHAELEGRRAEAERLNDELRTLDRMKSDLLANVSHELQTPLVSVRGYTEMILKGRLGAINDEQKQGLSLSLRNIDRLIAMIDNLLAFARMDKEAGPLTLQTFPVAPVVDEALALLREGIEGKRLHVARQVPDPSPLVRADRDKILQVFVNLLSNAVKFNRDGGSIVVEVRPGKPGFVLVQVVDTGVGIAKDELEKIFDRFYRVDQDTQHRADGTGIGLAIVRNILRAHGCVIHASSDSGQGATFAFTLPLAGEGTAAREAVTPVAEPSQPPRVEPAAAEDDSRPRLRIIRRS